MKTQMKLFSDQISFTTEFKRCCLEYDKVQIYSAWIGNPQNMVPFEYFKSLKSVEATIGVSFFQSSPEGIRFISALNKNTRIAKEDYLFHPKVYIFSKGVNKALFLGSSNLTYSGFYDNLESNILLEGNEFKTQILNYEKELSKWNTDECSFKVTEKWLVKYEEQYNLQKKQFKKNRIKDEAIIEDTHTFSPSWIDKADWELYIKRIDKGLKYHKEQFNEGLEEKLALLNKSRLSLPLPWKVEYFDKIENRRLITGMSGYGWLGHIGASGHVRHLFANGTKKEKKAIVDAVNAISKLNHPLDYSALKRELTKLVALGSTIKVWGRLLALTRPDLYCTVASPSVREYLSEKLHKPKSYFESIDGYVQLQKLIHASPWYKSKKPITKRELEIWKHRVAFLDVDFF